MSANIQQIYDGVPVRVTSYEQWSCCHCGFTHRLRFYRVKGKLWVRMWHHKPGTAARRKARRNHFLRILTEAFYGPQH